MAIVTEQEFSAELDRMISEVAQCAVLFYQYIEIHNCAAVSPDIYKALNGDAEFWNVNLYALQQTMFISLGRIFDLGPDTHSIFKLVKAAQANRSWFFKRAFRKRRMAASHGAKPAYLDGYVARIHIPSKDELRMLRKALDGPERMYRNGYSDVRNLHVGHTIVSDRMKIDQMFGKVVMGNTHEILLILSDVLYVLREIWQNGRKPVLGQSKFLSPSRIAKQTRVVMDRLVK